MGKYAVDKIDCSLRAIRKKLKDFPVTKSAIKATKRSYNKWNKWCSDSDGVLNANCALCNKYDYDCLGKCPLNIIGYNCIDGNSITLFDLAYDEYFYKNEPKPGKYSHKMRDILGRILTVLEEMYESKTKEG